MATEKPLRAMGMRIKGVLGIDELSIEFGQITVIKGGNGTGKTSVMEAMKAGIGGGDLAKLKKVRTDEDPEVVIVFDDGATMVERKGSETVVKQRVGNTAAYEKVRKPQTFLDKLFDQQLSNPLRFLNAHPSVRTDILLEALPLELDRAALMTAIGDAWPAGTVLPEGHPLQVLDAARTVLFDERTGVNRSAKDKASSAYELQKALPAEMPEDPAGDLVKARESRDTLFRQIADRKAEAEVAEQRAVAAAQAAYDQLDERIRGEFKTAAAKLRTAEATAIGEIQTEVERAIAEVRAKGDAAIAGVKERTTAAVDAEKARNQETLNGATATLDTATAAAVIARAQADAAVDALQPDLTALNTRVMELSLTSDRLVGLRKTKEMADRFEAEAGSLKDVSDRLTTALDAVEVFKAQLLNGLPIEGLEVRGKDIFINEIPFDQLNTAQRVKIAVKVATIRAREKRLPIMFVDGAEALDSATRGVLIDELEAAGVQAVMAMVDDDAGPLMIERDGGAAHAPEPVGATTSAPPRRSRGRAALTE